MKTYQRKKHDIERFPLGEFPKTILGKVLDDFLLSLWDTAINAPDPIRRFLYSYQIFEYCAFYFLKEELELSVQKLLLDPNIQAKIPLVAHQLLDLIAEDRTTDDSKMNSLIEKVITPCHLWKEIQKNIDIFSNQTEFEGGVTLSPIINKNATEEAFEKEWHPKIIDQLRKLRNALVHAREKRSSKCIIPTAKNLQLLRPWSTLAISISSELMIYGNATRIFCDYDKKLPNRQPQP